MFLKKSSGKLSQTFLHCVWCGTPNLLNLLWWLEFHKFSALWFTFIQLYSCKLRWQAWCSCWMYRSDSAAFSSFFALIVFLSLVFFETSTQRCCMEVWRVKRDLLHIQQGLKSNIMYMDMTGVFCRSEFFDCQQSWDSWQNNSFYPLLWIHQLSEQLRASQSILRKSYRFWMAL